MEPCSLKEKADRLKRAVSYGKENGKRSLVVNLDLLDEILRGNVPVGGNRYPPEEVNAKLYEIKAQRDKLLWKLSSVCDMANDELRRLGAVPGSLVSQIEADVRAVLDEVRGPLAELPAPSVIASRLVNKHRFAKAIEIVLRWCDRFGEEPEGQCVHEIEYVCRKALMLKGDRVGEADVGADDPTRKPLSCANCGQQATGPGNFTPDLLWLCSETCRKELCDKQSYDDLAASGGIVDAP